MFNWASKGQWWKFLLRIVPVKVVSSCLQSSNIFSACITWTNECHLWPFPLIGDVLTACIYQPWLPTHLQLSVDQKDQHRIWPLGTFSDLSPRQTAAVWLGGMKGRGVLLQRGADVHPADRRALGHQESRGGWELSAEGDGAVRGSIGGWEAWLREAAKGARLLCLLFISLSHLENKSHEQIKAEFNWQCCARTVEIAKKQRTVNPNQSGSPCNQTAHIRGPGCCLPGLMCQLALLPAALEGSWDWVIHTHKIPN